MKYIYLFLFIPAVAVLSACHKKDSSESSAPPVVDVADVITDSVTMHKTYPGTITAATKADVVGEVNGRLLSQNYKDGSFVSKGQILFTIDPTDYRAALQQAQASLTTARSQHDYYTRQYAAMKKALEAEAVSQMDVIQAENNLRQAAASIQSASAAVTRAQTDLSHCTVRAPVSGYISEATMSVGNYVSGGGTPQVLATIYDNSEFRANFNIEDAQYESMMSGNNTANSPAYRAIPLKFSRPLPHSYTADLFYESPSVNTSTGTLRLAGKVRNIDNELKDGMYVTVSLPYGTNPKAILVRDAALGTDQLGRYLYVVNDSDKIVYTPVTVGELFRDSLRVITKGVRPGQRYVTKALLTVRNGMKVKPRMESPGHQKTSK